LPASRGLGDRIKRLRLAADLTLKQVGVKSGVSTTHLSEIERGKTSPTVGALVRIAAALGEEASRLIDEEPVRRLCVVRAAERRELVENGVSLQPLTGAAGPCELSVLAVTLPPGSALPPLASGGEQLVVVVEGAVEIELSEPRRLRDGDALHFAGADCDGIRNRTESPARLLWASSPAVVL